MNRTLNQLINQLHLDPKKEAAVRKIVENAVSNNQSGGNNSGGSGPVIIEYPFASAEAVTLTDEQIEAFKNSNVKLKINQSGGYMILVPYFYGISEEIIAVYTRMMNPAANIIDVIFSIDVINKTIVEVN